MNINKINRVKINPYIPNPELKQLCQAKDVMENYMKDKNFNIDIEKSYKILGGLGNDYVAVSGWRNINNKILIIKKHVAKNGDEPFLRRVYGAIEELAHNFIGHSRNTKD